MTTLVVGATGELGGAIARKLLDAGVTVRALGRNPAKLAALEKAGAEIVSCDLLDRAAVGRACQGVEQICSTANNVLGSGANSPNRVDLPAYRNLWDAAAQSGVRRIVYISGRALGGAESVVDFFRVKHQLEELLKHSGVPYVILRASAFMDIWVPMIGDGIRKNNVATLFGNGTRVTNYIAVDDVAAITARILQRDDIQNETIDIGGPSNATLGDLAAMIEKELGVTATRRHIPVPVLRWGSTLLRPFHEVASRMMSLGYYSATNEGRFDEWQTASTRFGVSPMTLEAFVAEKYGKNA